MKHSLHPFPDPQAEIWQSFTLNSSISQQNSTLTIEFQLTGDLENLVWPSQVAPASRQDNLWETTCFEFFFSEPNSKAYWEVNLSPSGDWNVYSFSDYREGMTTENAIAALTIDSDVSNQAAQLSCSVPIQGLALNQQKLEVSITAVLALKSGDISYWATMHTASEADFHQRNSFNLSLN